MRLARLLPLALPLALAACFGPIGPVVGDWRGSEPSRSVGYQTSLELILDGPPGATTGTYHFLAQTTVTELGLNNRLQWSDTWDSRPLTVDGQVLELIHLRRLPSPHLPDYIRTAGNVLVPQANPARPDLSANALRVALYPVPPGSYGYGRP